MRQKKHMTLVLWFQLAYSYYRLVTRKSCEYTFCVLICFACMDAEEVDPQGIDYCENDFVLDD